VGSGIDLDGGDDKVGLVSHPTSTAQIFSSSEPMSMKNSPDASKTTDEEEVYSLSHREGNYHPQSRRRHLNYSKMPNSCRIPFDSKLQQNPGASQEIFSARSW